MRYPAPTINYAPLKPLTDELHNGLLNIYKRTKTYITSFEVIGFTGTYMSWPETNEEHQWILDNILPFFNISVGECLNLQYTEVSSDPQTHYFRLLARYQCCSCMEFTSL